jgi:mRNA interferase MazF
MAMRQKMRDYMTTIQSDDFWLARIPYTNGSNFKKRPVLILWLDGNDAVVTIDY